MLIVFGGTSSDRCWLIVPIALGPFWSWWYFCIRSDLSFGPRQIDWMRVLISIQGGGFVPANSPTELFFLRSMRCRWELILWRGLVVEEEVSSITMGRLMVIQLFGLRSWPWLVFRIQLR